MEVDSNLRRACCALTLLLAAACSREQPVARRNVLLIAVDTLRADRLGCYGNTRGLTPNIDALAREGVRFENAFAHAPWTLPSFASLFSSLYPQQHGAGGNVLIKGGFLPLPDAVETLAERFRAQDYATGAIVNVDFLARNVGVTQGFDTVDVEFSENNRDMRRASATTDAAVHWLEGHRDLPFMLLVHYFDPHAEYDPPQPFRRQFAREQDREATGFEFGTRNQVVGHRLGSAKLNTDDIRRAESLYDGEVAYTDAQIGRLRERLNALGLAGNTLIVLTSDHGEEFLDHGDYEHGHTLYDELLHVPLIMHLPKVLAARVVREGVAHVDVAPTVCALCDVPAAPSFVGHDLRPLFDGAAPAPLRTIAFGNFWGAPLKSLRTSEFKLIEKPAAANGPVTRELYRWRDDPHELHDLASTQPAVVNELHEDLELFEQAFRARRASAGPPLQLTPAQRQRLKSFGYAGLGEEPASGAQDGKQESK